MASNIKNFINLPSIDSSKDSIGITPVEGQPIIVVPGVADTAGRVTKVTLTDATWTLLERGLATTPTGAGPLASRVYISVQNDSGKDILVQYESSPSDDTVAMVIPTGTERRYEIGPSIQLYAMSSSGNRDVVFEEIS